MLHDADAVDLDGAEDPGETDGRRQRLRPAGHRRPLLVLVIGLAVVAGAVIKPWALLAGPPAPVDSSHVEAVQGLEETQRPATVPAADPTPTEAVQEIWAVMPPEVVSRPGMRPAPSHGAGPQSTPPSQAYGAP